MQVVRRKRVTKVANASPDITPSTVTPSPSVVKKDEVKNDAKSTPKPIVVEPESKTEAEAIPMPQQAEPVTENEPTPPISATVASVPASPELVGSAEAAAPVVAGPAEAAPPAAVQMMGAPRDVEPCVSTISYPDLKNSIVRVDASTIRIQPMEGLPATPPATVRVAPVVAAAPVPASAQPVSLARVDVRVVEAMPAPASLERESKMEVKLEEAKTQLPVSAQTVQIVQPNVPSVLQLPTVQAPERLDVVETEVETEKPLLEDNVTLDGYWVVDPRLRLESDTVATRLGEALDAEVAEAERKFKERSRLDPVNPFRDLVTSFLDASASRAAQDEAMNYRCSRAEEDLKGLWTVHVESLTQSKRTSENVKVDHTFTYDVYRFERDRMAKMAESLEQAEEKGLPELTLARFAARRAFLNVEIYLSDTVSDLDQKGRVAPVGSGGPTRHDAALDRLLRCADVLFHTLRGVPGSPGIPGPLKLGLDSIAVETLRKWVRLVCSWVHGAGSQSHRQYLFQHILRLRGVGSWGRLIDLSPRDREWSPSDHRHFLKMLKLLMLPGVDSKSRVSERLSEVDTTSLLAEFPIKFIIHSAFRDLFVEAMSLGRGSIPNEAVRSFATAKTIANSVIDGLRNSNDQRPQYARLLCQTLGWISQCIVNTYHEHSKKRLGTGTGAGTGPGDGLHALVQREFDWICVRCLSAVNVSRSAGCKYFLSEFPLRYLSCSGSSLAFRVLFEGTPPERLSDSGRAAQPLRIAEWSKNMAACATPRSRFVHAVRASRNANFLMLALSALAKSQTQGSDLPRVWLGELFIVGFANPDTKAKFGAFAVDLMVSLCSVHPRLCADIIALTVQFSAHPAADGDLLRSLATSLDMSGFRAGPGDVMALGKLLSHRFQTWQSRFAQALLVKLPLEHPADDERTGPPEKINSTEEKSAAEFPAPARLTAQFAILRMLADARLKHISCRQETQSGFGVGGMAGLLALGAAGGSSVAAWPGMKWWVSALTRIRTRDLTGSPFCALPNDVPSRLAVDASKLSRSKLKDLVARDPVLVYARLVATPGSTKPDVFKKSGWPAVKWLLGLPAPARNLGFCALYMLIPGLAGIPGDSMDKLHVVAELLEPQRPRGLVSMFAQDTTTFNVTKALKNIMLAHVANCALEETRRLRSVAPMIPINALFEESDHKSIPRGSTSPVPVPALRFWLRQIENGAPSNQRQIGMLRWLKDHNCRFLMNSAIRAAHVLQPVDGSQRIATLSKFLREQTEQYSKLAARKPDKLSKKDGGGLCAAIYPPVSALRSLWSSTAAAHPWLIFQILMELTRVDSVAWARLGTEVTGTSFATPLRRALTKYAGSDARRKIIMWESMLREWLAAAIALDADHPLQPLFWQVFFKLYFSQAERKAPPTDNPGRFYGFRWLMGKTGSALQRKGMARLAELSAHYDRKAMSLARGKSRDSTGDPRADGASAVAARLSRVFPAMRLWLEQRPDAVNSLGKGKSPPPGIPGESRDFIMSRCPSRREPERYVGWYVNQLHLRAAHGALAEKFCPSRLLRVIMDDPLDPTRRTLWFDLVDMQRLWRNASINAQQYVPQRLFRKVFCRSSAGSATSADAKNAPASTAPSAAAPAVSLDKSKDSSRVHDLLEKARLRETRNPGVADGLVLTLPDALRAPVWRALDARTLKSLTPVLTHASQSYSRNMSRLKALDIELAQNAEQLWRNVPESTTVNRTSKKTTWSKSQDATVSFTFQHTKPVRDDTVAARMRSNRTAARAALLGPIREAALAGHVQAISGFTGAMLLVGRIISHLVESAEKAIAGTEQARAVAAYGRDWLFGLIELDSPQLRTFPPTKQLIPVTVASLARFCGKDFASQRRCVGILRDHPALVDCMLPAFEPQGILFNGPAQVLNSETVVGEADAKQAGGAHDRYLVLYGESSLVRLQIGETSTQLTHPGILARFRVGAWLAGRSSPAASAGPPSESHTMRLMQTALGSMRRLWAQTPPPVAEIASAYASARDRVMRAYVEHIRACASYKFPSLFLPLFETVVEDCVLGEPRLPPQMAWGAVSMAPIQALQFAQQIQILKSLSDKFESLLESSTADAAARAKGSRGGDAKAGQVVNMYNCVHAGAINPMFAFVRALVVAALRRLFLVKANVSNRRQSDVDADLIISQTELFGAVWNAFRPWLAPRKGGRQPWGAGDAASETVLCVCREFAQVLTLVADPAAAIFGESRDSHGDSSTLWPPSKVLLQLWSLYQDHIAPFAEPHVLSPLQKTFMGALHATTATKNPGFPRESLGLLPLSALELTNDVCADMHGLLRRCGGDGKAGRARAVCVAVFLSRWIGVSDFSRILFRPKNTGEERKGREARGPLACSSVDLVIACAHVSLLAPMPLDPAFAVLCVRLLGLDWQGVTPEQYERLLVTVSDLLYKFPGAPPGSVGGADGKSAAGSMSIKCPAPAPPQGNGTVHFFRDAELDALPRDPRGIPGFLLRLVLAMAQPIPGVHKPRSIVPGLVKLRLYTEWLLSVFHKGVDAKPLASERRYARLARLGVLRHVNIHRHALFKTGAAEADRIVVDILREVALLVNRNSAQSRHVAAGGAGLMGLTRSMLRSNPGLTHQTLAACCGAILSLPRLSDAIDACVSAAVTTRGSPDSAGDSPGGADGFDWRVACGMIRIPEISEAEFFEAAAKRGNLYTLLACALAKVLAATPRILGRSPDIPTLGKAIGGDSAGDAQAYPTIGDRGSQESRDSITRITATSTTQIALTASQDAVCRLVGWLGAATAGHASATRSPDANKIFEHKAVSAWRAIVHVQTRIVALMSQNGSRRLGKADKCLSDLTDFLTNVYQESRFGTSGFGRWSGKILGVVGLGKSQYSPRFRLAARALVTYLAVYRAGNAFSWTKNSRTASQGDSKRLIAELVALEKHKSYAELVPSIRAIVGDIRARGSRGADSIMGIKDFLESRILPMYPEVAWPGTWTSGALGVSQ